MSNEDKKYSITLTLGDTTLTGEGKSTLEALVSIKKPLKIFQKGLITVKEGKRMMHKSLTVVQTKRLFFPLAQEIQAKQLEYLMK